MAKTTGHTPRPWHVGTDGNVYTGDTGGVLVATVSHNANGPDAPSSKPANARLIAKSPELLAKLREVLEWMRSTREPVMRLQPDAGHTLAGSIVALIEEVEG